MNKYLAYKVKTTREFIGEYYADNKDDLFKKILTEQPSLKPDKISIHVTENIELVHVEDKTNELESV